MGMVGVAGGIVLGLVINGIFMKVGINYSSFSGITDYMALINGWVYPTWGADKLLQRALSMAIISTLASLIPAHEAAQREPAEALHFV